MTFRFGDLSSVDRNVSTKHHHPQQSRSLDLDCDFSSFSHDLDYDDPRYNTLESRSVSPYKGGEIAYQVCNLLLLLLFYIAHFIVIISIATNKNYCFSIGIYFEVLRIAKLNLYPTYFRHMCIYDTTKFSYAFLYIQICMSLSCIIHISLYVLGSVD